jgi:predicted ester cyclase
VTVAIHAAFCGFEVEVLHCVGDGDLVASHKMFRGTHTGDRLGIAPSGNRFGFAVMDLVRCRYGRMVEHWAVADALGFLRRTGALA